MNVFVTVITVIGIIAVIASMKGLYHQTLEYVKDKATGKAAIAFILLAGMVAVIVNSITAILG